MKDREPVSIPWDEVLSTKSVAFHALTQPERVADLLPPDVSCIDEVLEKRRSRFAGQAYRDRLCEALGKNCERLGAPDSSAESIRMLRNPDTFLVVTGQQAGLLTGPLYTIYKVATAIALARRLTAERSETFLPCFWCASEDHDFEEVRSIALLDRESAVQEFRMPSPAIDGSPIYGLSVATCPINELNGFLAETLRPTEFASTYQDLVEKTYGQSRTLSEWMVRLLWSLFADDGLVVVLPEDGFYQREARDILAREIENPAPSVEAVRQAGDELERRGLESQVHKAEQRSSFFLVRSDGERCQRVPVYVDEGAFTDGEKRFSKAEMLKLLDEQPLSISAGATLRPVCQDAALPTAVAVLGPGEINYYSQIGGVYRNHNVPWPAFQVRLSATFLPVRLWKTMDQTGLGFSDFKRDSQWLLRDAVKRTGPDAAADALERLRRSLQETFAVLHGEAQRLDPTIVGALEKDRKGIEKSLGRAENLLTRRRADKERTLARRIDALQAMLFPRHGLQERVLNVFYFLNLYGPDFISQVKGLAARDAGAAHYLVPL